MNFDNIKRAKDLHFPVPEDLAESIDRLVDAIKTNNKSIDCYMADLEGGTRMVEDEYGRWIYEYYLLGGWQDDVLEEDDMAKTQD